MEAKTSDLVTLHSQAVLGKLCEGHTSAKALLGPLVLDNMFTRVEESQVGQIQW